MGISRSNFRYAGTHISDSSHDGGAQRFQALLAYGNGGSWHQGSGGEAAFGSVVPHSFLSGTAPASAGDYCTGYMYGQASVHSNNGYQNACLMAAFVTTGSDSGSDFPVDATPAEGTAIAYSIRAFVRLDNHNSSINANYERNQGSEIGLFVKGVGPGTNQQGDYAASPTGSLSASYLSDNSEDATDGMLADNADFNPRMSGYCLTLSTLRDDSDGAQGGGEAGQVGARVPRLKFHAHKTNDITHAVNSGTNSLHETVFSGSFNTWYHVRMDVTPQSSADKIEIYSAPISETLSNETWTKHTTITIQSTDSYYRQWDSSNSTLATQDCGYYTAHAITHDDDYLCHDALIDGFEFFTKDVS